MPRAFFYFAAAVVVCALIWWQEKPNFITPFGAPAAPTSAKSTAYASRTWGNPATLPDHFARHGKDFGVANAEDYARLAYEFFQRAQKEGWIAKVDKDNVYRIFDERSGAFGAYNSNGTTKTFFKPNSRRYFDRQPGQRVSLRTPR